MKIKMTGFDKMHRNLDRLARNAKALHGRHEVSFEELFGPRFMQANTKYESFEALLEASPFKVETKEDFAAIPKWDDFIREATRFGSWEEMMQAAAAEYAKCRLMKGVR